jgi:DNA-binding transcriptional ArsR family regulator
MEQSAESIETPAAEESVIPFKAFISHPMRLEILDHIARHGARSPSQLIKAVPSKPSIGTLSYHVREMADAGVLKLVSVQPRRGANEHFYDVDKNAAASLRAFITLLEFIATRFERPEGTEAPKTPMEEWADAEETDDTR